MEERVSWYPIAPRESLSPTTQALFAQLDEKLGFVPNVFVAFAWKGERFERWREHFELLMKPTPGLGKAEREMISLAVSMQNQCLYCLTAHGFALRAILKDPVTADRITFDYKRAGLDDRDIAMLNYAVKITLEPAACDEVDIEELREFGFEDEDIWDIAEVAAMFNFTNRLASATGMLPNREYQSMAR